MSREDFELILKQEAGWGHFLKIKLWNLTARVQILAALLTSSVS